MRKILGLMLIGLLFAVPASAGLYVFGEGEYRFTDRGDFGDYNVEPVVGAGLTLGLVKFEASHGFPKHIFGDFEQKRFGELSGRIEFHF